MHPRFFSFDAGRVLLTACTKEGDLEIVPYVASAKGYVGIYKGIWRQQVGRKDGQGVYKDSSYAGTCEIVLADSGRSFKVNGFQFLYRAGQTRYGFPPVSFTIFPQADSIVYDFCLDAGYSGTSCRIPWQETTFCGKR